MLSLVRLCIFPYHHLCMTDRENLLLDAHAFMAERPYLSPRPNEIREHHGLYNILINNPDMERAGYLLEQVLGAFGLVKAGIIIVDEHLMSSISTYTDEDGVELREVELKPEQIIQFDYASKRFSVIELAEQEKNLA